MGGAGRHPPAQLPPRPPGNYRREDSLAHVREGERFGHLIRRQFFTAHLLCGVAESRKSVCVTPYSNSIANGGLREQIYATELFRRSTTRWAILSWRIASVEWAEVLDNLPADEEIEETNAVVDGEFRYPTGDYEN